MAGVMNTVRVSTRTATKYASAFVSRRAFTTSTQRAAATNFTMPALSPTMTEGNIAQWRVKEGESYSAGDVLLEIETDKATMDVEAQDDGILMKITSGDGSKAVKVGNRIAVMAEAGDDINSLEIPQDDSSPSQQPKQEDSPKETSKITEASEGSEPAQAGSRQESSEEKKPSKSGKQSGTPQKQKYPLYPSVQHLLHENGLSDATANEIPASGPGGRLLKGDVLAYLGKIDKNYPSEASARLNKLSHLDLSNIQIATPPPKTAEKDQKPVKAIEEEIPQDTELAVPISLTAVIAAQRRVERVLRTSVPLSVFIARASELANEDLPLSKKHQPTADDLFDSVLGITSPARTVSRGHFVPSISTFDLDAPVPSKASKDDIFDILTGSSSKAASRRRATSTTTSTGENLFSVVARPGEEKRAAIYLERMKSVLEQDPGRVIL